LIIAAMLYRFDPAEVMADLRSARPLYLALALIVYAVTFLILSLRWRMILSRMGAILPISVAYQALAGGMIISDLTPARIGELSRPLLVRDQVDLNKGIASVAIDRYADILTIFILGLSGIMFLAQRSAYTILAAFTVLFVLLAASLFWMKRPYMIKQCRRLGSSRLNDVAQNLDSALGAVVGVRELLVKAVLLTAIAWIIQALRVVLIAKSLGYDVPLPVLFLLQPLVSALALIPVTISGLGLVEGGLTALLAGLGVPASAGIAIALIDRILTVAFHILIGGRYAARVL
jgi:uncharacterized protein (TIRG00374 family)